MTDTQIVTQSVLKGEKNGFQCNDTKYFLDNKLWEMIIFRHDFAKAFWGEDKIMCYSCNQHFSNFDQYAKHAEYTYCNLYEGCDYIDNWKYHLQQMILEKNHIQYLKRFLDN